MADKKPSPPMPGVAPKKVKHRVLYMRREPTAAYQAMASYEQGNAEDEQQGKYLFESVRAEHINKARAAAASIPFFLEQSEIEGLKVED